MRRFARTAALASTAAFAAAAGAVALAPIASAQEEEMPTAPFGSSLPEMTDLAVGISAICAPVEEDGDDVAALRVAVKNVGEGPAANVTTNYGVFPDLTGVRNEEVIEADEEVVYIVPSGVTEWSALLGGAAVFSTNLDGNYADNIAVEVLNIDCTPEVVEQSPEE